MNLGEGTSRNKGGCRKTNAATAQTAVFRDGSMPARVGACVGRPGGDTASEALDPSLRAVLLLNVAGQAACTQESCELV